MKFTLSAILYLMSITYMQAKVKTSIVLFINDSKTTSSDLKSMANVLYLDGKLQVDQFTVFHFSNKAESSITWSKGKRVVDYKPQLIDCNFSFCNEQKTLISANRSENNILFSCGASSSCDSKLWGPMEISTLTSKDASVLSEKIKDEITNNKKLKKNLTLFFCIGGEQSELIPTVTFQSDTIEVKSDETKVLNPLYSKDISKIEWNPAEGLSCSDCATPTLQPSKNNIYTVTVTNSQNCKATSKPLTVIVKSNCHCNEALMPVSDIFNDVTIEKYVKVDDESIADWQMISNQSGGFVFNFITTPNCASRFRVKIHNSRNERIWEDLYTRNEVDSRGGHDWELKDEHPDYFVYRIDLSRVARTQGTGIRNPNDNFTISIESVDDKNKGCSVYQSPRIIFSRCN